MKRVYVHGLGQTSKSWEKTISRSKHKEHIICPNLADLVQADGVDYKRLYFAFSRLCDQLGKPLDLCGLSLGSVLALNYAIDYPNRVHSLALIAPQYKMPKRLLQFQNSIFHLMPRSAFTTTGFIAIQGINKEYQRQKTNQRSPKDGSARKPQQYHAEAGIIP